MQQITEVKQGKEKIGVLFATDRINHFVFWFYPSVKESDRNKKIKELKEMEERTGLKIEVKS